MDETFVKKYLNDYLKNKNISYESEFSLLSGGRVDFLSYYWKNDYEISINGYECKGNPSPYSVAKIIREQIMEYQKAIQKTYLVVGSSRINELNTLCRVNSVGLINIKQDGSIKIIVEPPEERHLFLEDTAYKNLRSISAMYLTFEEKFGSKLRKGSYWRSTPEPNNEAQFNMGYAEDTGSVYFSINIENSLKILNRINLKRLHSELINLSDDYWINAGITIYHVPRKGIYTTIINTSVTEIEMADLEYLKEKAQDNIVFLQITTNVWDSYEILSRRIYLSRVEIAMEQLYNIKNIM